MFDNLPKCGASAFAPPSQNPLLTHTHQPPFNHMHLLSPLPPRHTYVPASSRVCMFDSLPKHGLSAFAPSSSMSFPAHASHRREHTRHKPLILQPSANQDTYIEGPACACLTACPGDSLVPSLLRCRCRSLHTTPIKHTPETSPASQPNPHQHGPESTSVCTLDSLPNCGANAFTPSLPMPFAEHASQPRSTHMPHASHHTTEMQHEPQSDSVTMLESLPKYGARAFAPSTPIPLSAYASHHNQRIVRHTPS